MKRPGPDLEMHQETTTGSFVISALPRTVATLEGQPELDVSDWLDRLPQHHERDEPIDRLLVAALPHFGIVMVRHYALDGPSLLEKIGRRLVTRIDRLLAEHVVIVAGKLSEDASLRNLSLSAPQELLGRIFPKK